MEQELSFEAAANAFKKYRVPFGKENLAEMFHRLRLIESRGAEKRYLRI